MSVVDLRDTASTAFPRFLAFLHPSSKGDDEEEIKILFQLVINVKQETKIRAKVRRWGIAGKDGHWSTWAKSILDKGDQCEGCGAGICSCARCSIC